MNTITVGHERFDLGEAELEFYHCDSEAEADWNLRLARPDQGTSLYLAGTVLPAPRQGTDLAGATFTVELRSIDEVLEGLLGRALVVHVVGDEGRHPRLTCRSLGGERVALDASFEFEPDRPRDTLPTGEARATVSFRIEATVVGHHPGQLPG